MPIDASILLGAKAPQINPMELLGQTAGIAGKLNENRLFQQKYAGQVALGHAAAGATKDGQLDARAMLQGLANDPNGAFLVPEAAAQAQAREKEQLGIDASQLALSQSRVKAAADAVYPLLGSDPATLTKTDVWKAARTLAGMDVFKDPKAMQSLVTTIQGLPEEGPQLQAALKQFYLQANAGSQGAAAVGTPGMVNTGARQIATMTSPLTGKVTPTGEFATEMGPSETVEVYDPASRSMKLKPKAAVFGATGQGGPSAGVAAGPPLGASEAASVTGAESAKQGIGLQSAADQVPQRRATLMSMRDQLRDFNSGPMADKMSLMRGLATRFGLTPPTGDIATSQAANEEFNKLSTQIVLQQVQQLGGAGTDDKLAAGIKGNPSETLSKLGNERVIALMLGNEDAINAKNGAWQKWAERYGPESYGRFTQEFNTVYDPRVFQWAYMKTPDRVKLAQGMTKGEKADFDEHFRIAKAAGWVK